MPVMGLGTWQLTGDAAAAAVTFALKQGYRMFDTAGEYGNQPQIGQAIRDSGVRRQDIFVITSVEEDEDTYDAAQKDLAELGLDYADLILLHHPPTQGAGTHLWEGLIRAWEEGRARDIGVSNYSIEQIHEIAFATQKMPVVNQVEWSPFGYSQETFDYCKQHNIVIQASCPLTRTKRLNEPILADIATKYNKTPAQLLIRWDIQHGVVPLPKATSQEHIQENRDVFDFTITADDMAVLDSLNEHYSALTVVP